jgi:xylulokinase
MNAGAKPLVLGIDLGTSAVKVGLFSLRGEPVAVARETYPLHAPRPGWAEQMPADWWAATCRAVRRALAETQCTRIVAVGLCGQTPGHVLVDSAGDALGPAITWQDRRAEQQAAWLAERVTEEQAQAWVGLRSLADSALPPARLKWLASERRDDWVHCQVILQPKDYLALRLTGACATDIHSGFALVDPEVRRYSDALLALLEVEGGRLPRLLKPTDIVGSVTSAAAEETGLPAGLPVATGTVDAWSEIIGCGGAADGRAADIAGTSEVVAVVTDRPVQGADITSSELIGGLHWLGGPTQAGGDALSWLARGFYAATDADAVLARIEAEAASVEPGSDGLVFLPYLNGERAPIWDGQARAAFVGLTSAHGREHCARAVYEGVAFAVRHILAVCEEATGLRPEALRVSGGGSRSRFWNQIKADVTGMPVLQCEVAEAGALGAALLAAVAVGAHGNHASAAAEMVRILTRIEPNAALKSRYDDLFRIYRQLYPTLREIL